MYFEVADIINIVSIFLNIIILILVAIFFQNIQVNSRTLKDYYIKEYDFRIKELFTSLIELENGAIFPKKFRSNFFNHVSAFGNVREALLDQYDIDINNVIINILSVQQSFEDDPNFSNNFENDSETFLNQETIDFIRNKRTDQLEKNLYQIVNKINNKKTNIFKSLIQ